METDQVINKIIDLVRILFPDLRIWQLSQIGVKPELWRFWLTGFTETNFEIYVDAENKCTIAIYEEDLRSPKNQNKVKAKLKGVVNHQTPEEIANIICDHFIEVTSKRK